MMYYVMANKAEVEMNTEFIEGLEILLYKGTRVEKLVIATFDNYSLLLDGIEKLPVGNYEVIESYREPELWKISMKVKAEKI